MDNNTLQTLNNEKIDLILPEENLISNRQRFWFIRTDGGRLYSLFKNEGLIAIDYNEISLDEIFEYLKKNKLETLIKRRYPKEKRPGFKTSQIKRFFIEMRPGDLVVIPSASSSNLSIGRVDEGEVFEKQLYLTRRDGSKTTVKGYKKCRRVEWLSHKPRTFVNPKLLSVIYSHQTIVELDKYAQYVSNLIYDFYKLNDHYHLVLPIKSSEIHAIDLFDGIGQVLKVIQNIANDEGQNLNFREIKTGINVNSPGVVEFAAYTGVLLVALGSAIIFLNGGKLKYKNFSLESKGLIRSIQDFLESRDNSDLRRELVEKIKHLKIEDPQDILKLLESDIDERKENTFSGDW